MDKVVLNVALWKTPANSIEHHGTIFIGASRKIYEAIIMFGRREDTNSMQLRKESSKIKKCKCITITSEQ